MKKEKGWKMKVTALLNGVYCIHEDLSGFGHPSKPIVKCCTTQLGTSKSTKLSNKAVHSAEFSITQPSGMNQTLQLEKIKPGTWKKKISDDIIKR